MTVEDLRSRMAWWQRRLRMQDWRIELTVGRRSAMPESTSSAAGMCRWDLCSRIAFVHLVEEEDLKGLDAPYRDQELTLVHELLHVLYAAAASSRDQDGTGWEQAHNAAAEALVALARGMETGC